MHKRKYSELLSEEKKQGVKRKRKENNTCSKKPRNYPQFEALAAHFKGYLERARYIRKIYTFYS